MSFATIEILKTHCQENAIFCNTLLIKELEDKKIPLEAIPTAKSFLYCLMLTYKRFSSLEELQLASRQSASQISALRKLGYVFEKSNPHSGNYTTAENGIVGRRIIFFDRDMVFSDRGNILLTKTERFEFLKGKEDFVTGQSRELEIDHRQPREASTKLGYNYPHLDSSTLHTSEDYYQVLTRETNLKKKSSCQQCMSGKPIPILPLGKLLQKEGYLYKTYFEDHIKENIKNNRPPCFGCFWYNHEKPLKKTK